MKTAVFTVMLPDLSPEEAARDIKAAGYDGAEWRVAYVPENVKNDPPSFWGNNRCTFAPTEDAAERAKAISERAGLETPTIGTYIGLGDMAGVKAAIRFATILGSPHFRVGFGNFTGDYAQHFADARAFLSDVIVLGQTCAAQTSGGNPPPDDPPERVVGAPAGFELPQRRRRRDSRRGQHGARRL